MRLKSVTYVSSTSVTHVVAMDTFGRGRPEGAGEGRWRLGFLLRWKTDA